jgi:SAM-dependent methyltransferase
MSKDARAADLVHHAIDLAQRRHRSPLAKDVAALSRLLTDERSHRDAGYLSSPQHRRAYLAYYAPRNSLRIARLLRELGSEGWVPTTQSPTVLDLGSGPLSGVLGAWIHYGQLRGATAVDLAAGAIRDGRELLARAAPKGIQNLDARVASLTGAPEAWRPPAPVDLAILANVLNELGDPRRGVDRRIRLVAEAIDQLAPDGRLLIVEPATRVQSRGLMRLRDELVEEGIGQLLAPCTGAEACPLLKTRGDWCHDELAWEPPEEMKRLARKAGLRPTSLKHSYLLLARADAELETPKGLRVVSGGVGRGARHSERLACTADGLVRLRPRGGGKDKKGLGAVGRVRRGGFVAKLPDDVRANRSEPQGTGEPSAEGASTRRSRKRRGSGAD